MKKKIILILSMCALLICLFVLSASATIVFCSPDGVSNDFKGISASQYVYDAENDFAIQELTVYDDAGTSYTSYLVSNPVSLKNYLNGFSNFDNFRSAHENNTTDLENIFYYFQEYAFNYFVNYVPLTQEDLTVQYNQGKTDGVTEYKESEEYSNVLSTQYNQGKTDGVAEFKDSEAYETVLAVERSIGASEGVANYLDSTEYADTLQAEYDKGYDDAESEKASNMLGTALGSVGIVVFVLLGVWLWLTLSKKKKRRR